MLQTRRRPPSGKERIERRDDSDYRNEAQPAADKHPQRSADKLNAIGGIHSSDVGLERIAGAALVVEAGVGGLVAWSALSR